MCTNRSTEFIDRLIHDALLECSLSLNQMLSEHLENEVICILSELVNCRNSPFQNNGYYGTV